MPDNHMTVDIQLRYGAMWRNGSEATEVEYVFRVVGRVPKIYSDAVPKYEVHLVQSNLPLPFDSKTMTDRGANLVRLQLLEILESALQETTGREIMGLTRDKIRYMPFPVNGSSAIFDHPAILDRG